MEEEKPKIEFTSDYICHECGIKYGTPSDGVSTMHTGICGICGENRGVMHQRNYGWFMTSENGFILKDESAVIL